MDRLSGDTLLWCQSPGSSALVSPKIPDNQDLCAAVRSAVASVLTARQRQVVEGYFFQNLSQGELARQLGITQQVVHKCLYGTRRNGRRIGGALEKLRAALAPLVQNSGREWNRGPGARERSS